MPKIHITLDDLTEPEVQIARSQDGTDRTIVLLKLTDQTTEITIAADAAAAAVITRALDRVVWREAAT